MNSNKKAVLETNSSVVKTISEADRQRIIEAEAILRKGIGGEYAAYEYAKYYVNMYERFSRKYKFPPSLRVINKKTGRLTSSSILRHKPMVSAKHLKPVKSL